MFTEMENEGIFTADDPDEDEDFDDFGEYDSEDEGIDEDDFVEFDDDEFGEVSEALLERFKIWTAMRVSSSAKAQILNRVRLKTCEKKAETDELLWLPGSGTRT